MTCGSDALKSRVYVATVTTDDALSGTPPYGQFNPITELLPSLKFMQLRITVEVLSATPNIILEPGGRSSNDGVTFDNSIGLQDEIHPSTDPWYYGSFQDLSSGVENFLQLGLWARKSTGSSSREMAVVRMRLDFKDTPLLSGGGA